MSLLLSPVPTLHGNFPQSVSIVLRTLALVDAVGSKDPRAVHDMLRLLEQPFYVIGQESKVKQKLRHLFVFAADFLLRHRLLDVAARCVKSPSTNHVEEGCSIDVICI